jgi:hypothetical protein
VSTQVSLASIPVQRRRQAGLMAAAVALPLIAAGAVALIGTEPVVLRVLGALVLLAGLAAAFIARAMLRNVTATEAEAELDAVVTEAAGLASGPCDCGQVHDPDEMHITDAGSCDEPGDTCAHDCASCLLGASR